VRMPLDLMTSLPAGNTATPTWAPEVVFFSVGLADDAPLEE